MTTARIVHPKYGVGLGVLAEEDLWNFYGKEGDEDLVSRNDVHLTTIRHDISNAEVMRKINFISNIKR